MFHTGGAGVAFPTSCAYVLACPCLRPAFGLVRSWVLVHLGRPRWAISQHFRGRRAAAGRLYMRALYGRPSHLGVMPLRALGAPSRQVRARMSTVTLPTRVAASEWSESFSAGKLREAAVLDSEFRADSETGLRSAQSPAGEDEKFSQSPAADEMRCVLAGCA